jgi:hypothetical protein
MHSLSINSINTRSLRFLMKSRRMANLKSHLDLPVGQYNLTIGHKDFIADLGLDKEVAGIKMLERLQPFNRLKQLQLLLLYKRPLFIFLKRDPEFLLRIHDDGAVPGHRFFQGLPGDE